MTVNRFCSFLNNLYLSPDGTHCIKEVLGQVELARELLVPEDDLHKRGDRQNEGPKSRQEGDGNKEGESVEVIEVGTLQSKVSCC